MQDTPLTKEAKNNLLNVEGVCSDYDSRNSIHTKVKIPGTGAITINSSYQQSNRCKYTIFRKCFTKDTLYFSGNVFNVVSVNSDTQLTVYTVAANAPAAPINERRDYFEGIRSVDSTYKKFHHDRLFSESGAVYCYASGFLSQNKYLHLDHHFGFEFELL